LARNVHLVMVWAQSFCSMAATLWPGPLAGVSNCRPATDACWQWSVGKPAKAAATLLLATET
jgi:hypothetical protein